MIAIYRIVPDFERFAPVILRDPLGFRDRYREPFNGRPMKMPSEPILCTAGDRSKPLADFAAFLPGSFVVLARAAERRMHFEMAGQLVSLLVDGEPAYGINVTEVVNALHLEKPDVNAGRLTFHPFRLGATSLFKIPQTADREVLTHTGILDEDDDFITHYRRSKFNGLKFQQIWSDAD